MNTDNLFLPDHILPSGPACFPREGIVCSCHGFVRNSEPSVHEMYPKHNSRVCGTQGCTVGDWHWSIERGKRSWQVSQWSRVYIPAHLWLFYYVPIISLHTQIDLLSIAEPFFHASSLLGYSDCSHYSLFPTEELLITQYVNLTHFNPSLIAPHLSLHTDYASISYLLNYFTSQHLTEEI